ncbi:sphinganine-1-phosphate aldolase [Caenorhabditis elegans]|uniref:sphinganine-1-phosphate aldolase n=1 Tax=Caenorhabditis elegans TaxID=6239 RepID=A0A2X0T211_CAEEL|nr:Sphingosine Phosphate Lyase [Caenorhabditis elegans]SPS41586.1 Sphingosine Phosphate Lyase [Caenorhabditis elegans]|eukprot:NP_001350992.1 Sphingosine Phosphate Lyase [Caenorhabditis elegans]
MGVAFDSSDRDLSFRIALEYFDDLRILFNAKCSGLEPWQIVSYAISLCFLIAYIKRMTRSNEPPLVQIRKSIFSFLRSLPWVRRKLEADLAKAQAEIEDEVHQSDHMREFYKFLPERCMDTEEILADGRRYAMMGERRYMQHYDPQTREEDMKLSAKLFDLFAHTDPHRSDAFPGVRKMEAEILKMTCAMFHGGKDSCGVVAGGGTEALMLACLAYRNRSRARGEWRAEIVAPSTAHPALDKAAAFFDMTIKRIQVSETDDRANVGAMKRAIGPRTCMIIASAPNHITGTVDPIEKLAKLAQRYHIPLHVDCTLGGFVLPFMEYADYSVPAFDFRLPGVTSISADLHRYGQCPGRLSVLMYREPDT